MAVGGYGRGELSPRSDLDLVLLHDERRPERRPRSPTGSGTRSGTSAWPSTTRCAPRPRPGRPPPTTSRCSSACSTPGTSRATSALTAALRSAALADWRNQAPKRLPALHELCQERAERQGELSYLLEPDLKEARGGLRDATALRAVAASWLADAPREGLEDARTRLLDARDALHLVTGRATDRLALQEQDQVAEALGLLDADALLRQVYEAARTVAYASDVTWREVGRVLRARDARPRRRGLLGRGRPPAAGAPERVRWPTAWSSRRARRCWPAPPNPSATPYCRCGPPPPPHRPDCRCRCTPCAGWRPPPGRCPCRGPPRRASSWSPCSARASPPSQVWEALEAEGLITRLLPDWERVRCRPQRNAVHRFTVDRHLVETAVQASALTRRVGRPDLLLIAALLHDIGKGWPGDHSEAGEIIARDVAARIGFGRADVDTLALLVRHHLLLIDTATRRDLDDPATVRAVAETVRDTSTLELLHALTEADALATGPAAWSTWRASLLADLVERVGEALDSGALPETADRESTAEEERLAIEAARTGGPVLALHAHTEPEAEGDGAGPGAGRGTRCSPSPTARGCSPRPPGCSRCTGSPCAPPTCGPSTRSARARSSLLNWRVAAEYGSLPEAARLRADLVRAFDGTLDIESRLAEREAAYPRRRGVKAPPPRVSVAKGTSQTATVLEVRAHDAPGLLHRIGLALDRHRGHGPLGPDLHPGRQRGGRLLRGRQGRQPAARGPRRGGGPPGRAGAALTVRGGGRSGRSADRTRTGQVPWGSTIAHPRREDPRPTCSIPSPTALQRPSRTSAARAACPRRTSTPPHARSVSRCWRPTSRCPWYARSSSRSRSAPPAPRSRRR